MWRALLSTNSRAAAIYVRDGGKWKLTFHARAAIVDPKATPAKSVDGQQVADDGVGPATGVLKLNGSNGRSNGVGLDNVAQRLNALYQEQGRMTIEVRQAGGTRVTILLPRESGAAA